MLSYRDCIWTETDEQGNIVATSDDCTECNALICECEACPVCDEMPDFCNCK